MSRIGHTGQAVKNTMNLFITVLLLTDGVAAQETDVDRINADAPPNVDPPGPQCSCTWSQWMDGDNPNNDNSEGTFYKIYMRTFGTASNV